MSISITTSCNGKPLGHFTKATSTIIEFPGTFSRTKLFKLIYTLFNNFGNNIKFYYFTVIYHITFALKLLEREIEVFVILDVSEEV